MTPQTSVRGDGGFIKDEECLSIIEETGICARLLELSAKTPEAVGLREMVLVVDRIKVFLVLD